eukprot:363592-Chlamydomonas_euryale.AAC.9
MNARVDDRDLASPLPRSPHATRHPHPQAGFESALTEVSKRVSERASTATTAKEFLDRVAPLSSPGFHAALLDALAATEAASGGVVTMDPASEGYKAFAKKVEAAAAKAGLDVKGMMAGADSAAAAAEKAAAADAAADIAALRESAAAALDKHLGKTAAAVAAEQAAALAALQRKLASAGDAPWAAKMQADLKAVAWFDAAVAANPAAGPKATA